jgi:NAD(P)-dependent dehydrogenase (short-subunit alcohol dehydrogenase family)
MTRPWTEKTVVVTGATEGIGLVTAKEIAKRGARVVIVGRNPEKTKGRAEEVKAFAGHDRVEFALADFSKQSSIRALGKDLRSRLDRLDVLVNNAGAINEVRQTTEDGYELTFAANHLGYFLLTEELIELLKKSAPARIVNVASEAHRGGSMNFDDLQGEKSFSGFKAYNQSKLANILFTRELAKRLAGTGVTANCLHPGVIASGFGRNSEGWIGALARTFSFLLSTPESGAKTQIFLATSEAVEGVTGKYFDSCKEKTPSKNARNDADAARLWEISEKLVAKSANS